MTKVLEDAGLAYEMYSDIKANPTIENVQHGVEAFKAAKADYISLRSVEVPPWTLQRLSELSLPIRNLRM